MNKPMPQVVFHPGFKTRFLWKVQCGDGCWLMETEQAGYPRLKIEGSQYCAHRVSYAVHYGVDPLSLMVCHTCDNPACVNPKHLFLGTAKDNAEDKSRKGRVRRGRRHSPPPPEVDLDDLFSWPHV